MLLLLALIYGSLNNLNYLYFFIFLTELLTQK